MLEIGSFVFDKEKSTTVQVLEKLELWGYTSYKVFSPASGQVYKANEEQLNISGDEIYYDENYLRYVTLLAKIKNETSGGLLTSLSSGVIPLPHQLHALTKALENNNIRYILADEVGLGKTVEAGMIIKELKARGLVKRILVVCPTGLVTQWSSKMQEKFHEKFQVIMPSDYDTIRRLTDNDDVYTIPLWRNQMVLALGIEHTTRALNAHSAIDEMTNEMFKRNAETLKQGAIDAANASERGIVDVETLRKVNADIITSINEVVKIHEEGSKRRAEAQEELAKIEDELKQALLEAGNR